MEKGLTALFFCNVWGIISQNVGKSNIICGFFPPFPLSRFAFPRWLLFGCSARISEGLQWLSWITVDFCKSFKQHCTVNLGDIYSNCCWGHFVSMWNMQIWPHRCLWTQWHFVLRLIHGTHTWPIISVPKVISSFSPRHFWQALNHVWMQINHFNRASWQSGSFSGLHAALSQMSRFILPDPGISSSHIRLLFTLTDE